MKNVSASCFIHFRLQQFPHLTSFMPSQLIVIVFLGSFNKTQVKKGQ